MMAWRAFDGLMREALIATATVALPVAARIAAVAGTAVAVVQAATQVQEQTLSFLPKIIAVGFDLALFGATFAMGMLARLFRRRACRTIPALSPVRDGDGLAGFRALRGFRLSRARVFASERSAGVAGRLGRALGDRDRAEHAEALRPRRRSRPCRRARRRVPDRWTAIGMRPRSSTTALMRAGVSSTTTSA